MTHGPMTVCQRWTLEREERLIELWEADAPLVMISERLGATISSVVGKAYQIGLPRRASAEWSDDLVEKLTRLWADNYSASEIGRALGKTRNAVLGKAHRLCLSERKSILSEAEKAKRKTAREQARLAYKAEWYREQRAEAKGYIAPRPRRRPAPMPVWGGSLNIPLLDLRMNQCRFSYSATTPFLFCGQPVVEKTSWCAHCAAIVHQPPTPRPARRPFIIRRAA